MLRKIRIIAAAIFFTLITLLFLDFTGTIHAWFGWMAKIQFLPALLAMHVGIVLLLIVLTLVFGRVYCSVICPLGVMQDIISWFGGRRKKNRFSYSPAISWLRYGLLAVFVVALVAATPSEITHKLHRHVIERMQGRAAVILRFLGYVGVLPPRSPDRTES